MNNDLTATLKDLPSEWLSASPSEKEIAKRLLRAMRTRRELRSSEKIEIFFDKTGSPLGLGQYVLERI